ncbi:SEC-C motif-containing protein [Oceanobacillus limi]|uniref:SEC-C motif-containing protein n=1 Tax=Oceanobacillus limi TaxID=930131 RepID=A0A1H9Y1U7_9BACI|nr:SEC-C metal-binding domain-containing protein [Oceanobacillus limi]SES62780.1 SEC-C motif-containing protein [Oceanobacillus limi]
MYKELEESMIKAVTEKKEKLEQQEKHNKKYWSTIHVPITLDEGLRKYTKAELDAIRKRLHIKNASGLKKAELIALLQEKIPEQVEELSGTWDEERFNLLKEMANQAGVMEAPALTVDQVNYLRETGIIFTGIIEDKRILAIPEEVIEPIKSLTHNVNIRSKIQRNTNWVKLTNGLLYYYGTLELDQIVHLLETYTTEPIDPSAYVSVIQDANMYQNRIFTDEEGYAHHRVHDTKQVKQQQQTRTDISYYNFTKEQLLQAGEPGFVERNESYIQFVHFLTNTYDITSEEANSIVEECVYATKQGVSANNVLQYVASQVNVGGLDAVQAIMDHVVYLMNNTRKWELKGYTSTELWTEEKQLTPKTKNLTKKIGRNDPCPCGSGKKYKKCCGR